MKMAEISVGDIVVIGRNRGRDGTESTGVRATVLETGVMHGPYSFRQRPVGVRIKVDQTGRERTVASRDLLSLAGAEELEKEKAAAVEENTRRRNIAATRTIEIRELLARHGLTAIVSASYNPPTDGAVVNSIEFTNIRAKDDKQADTLVAFLERL